MLGPLIVCASCCTGAATSAARVGLAVRAVTAAAASPRAPAGLSQLDVDCNSCGS